MQSVIALVFLLAFVNELRGHLVIHVEEEDHGHSGTKFDCDIKRLQKLEADLAEIKENRLSQLEANVTDLRTKLEKTDGARKGCMDGWITFNESCYFFGNQELSFADSDTFCVSFHDAHLANIETEAENTFIRNVLRRMNVPIHWFGMTDEQTENVWKHYPSGKPATFMAWSQGEPNQGRGANCMVTWVGFDYLWADEPCTTKYKPICEKRAH